jgi:hypothetical protein
MYAIHIPTAPGPRAAPQALLIVQIPNAQEVIIVLQENYPTQRVKVCSSVRMSTMLLLQTQLQMQAQTQTHMLKIESKMSVRVSFFNPCIFFAQVRYEIIATPYSRTRVQDIREALLERSLFLNVDIVDSFIKKYKK